MLNVIIKNFFQGQLLLEENNYAKKMKKILIVSYNFPPEGGGRTVRIHNFVKYIPEFGYCPIVLTIDKKYCEGYYYNPSLLGEYTKEVSVIRTKTIVIKKKKDKGVNYKGDNKNELKKFSLIAMKIIKNVLIPDIYILWLPFVILNIRKLLKSGKFDLVLSTSPPFSSNVIAYLLSKIFKKPLVIDYRDDWVGNIFYAKDKIGIINRIESFAELKILKNSSRILTTTESSINSFKKKYPKLDSNKLVLLPNGFSPLILYSKKNNANIGSNKFVFTHIGSLTKNRSPYTFLKAVKNIINEKPGLRDKIRINFVGFCTSENIKIINSIGLGEIVNIKNNLKEEEVIDLLNNKTNACLIFQSRKDGGETAIPGKIYEYLAVRKPIICIDDNGATTKFLLGVGSKLNSCYGDIHKIESIIKMVIDNYKEISKYYMWDKEFLEVFNRRNQTHKLAKIFDEVLDV